MSLSIGRLGFIGVAVEPSYNTPTNPTDYIPFLNVTLQGDVQNDEITAAYQIREKIFDSVQVKQWSKGDVELYLDPKYSGYFFVSALGATQTVSLGAGVYKHIITRNNSNTPNSLSLIVDRVTDRTLYTGVGVDQLSLDVKDGLATMKATMIGQFPATSVSGAATTASGTVFAFPNAAFAFGTTVSGAQTNTNVKLSEFKLDIKNNAEAVFRHGSTQPNSINYKEFEATADFTLFFENTTDRNTFWNTSKQAANITFTGRSLPGGNTEQLLINLYRTHIEKFVIETGLANFYAEKCNLIAEFDNAAQRSLDVTLYNQTNNY